MSKNIIVTSENCQKGDLVVRGRDWTFGYQDEDSEYGEITKLRDDGTWVVVRWQNGKSNGYRVCDTYDLYFYTKKMTKSLMNRIGHLLK